MSERPSVVPAPDEPFWLAADEGRLCLQRCDDCGYVRWPAAGVCPECLGRASTWSEVSGRGTVWSFAIYHRAYARTGIPPLPYNVALIELECGARLLSRVVDCDASELRVGLPVSVRFAAAENPEGPGSARVPVFAATADDPSIPTTRS